MSRDWTPKELKMVQEQMQLPDLTDMMIRIGDEPPKPLYTDEEKSMFKQYPVLSRFGGDFLLDCYRNGILSNELGKILIQKLENYFISGDIDDKELQEKADLWYNGELMSGYDMGPNNHEFTYYIKSRCRKDGD